ncbi:motility associated factor glycosyltransferase family protein [Pseudoalteromonas viridis]|uniref:Motility associated factor glycosyltransferase family protein n=1 Tax=Pseudoalteromonas viridis TaxID=339617 RepID=A0ABX7UZY7_9GAMM|nr:6-hydroxymethylpterin diphosphokinase MptE-like protein [Pseudoalteromonas viridis]QTL34199.1 motility associated factor glycosyltransferase family protein [Pseudoalteromonas viridis]
MDLYKKNLEYFSAHNFHDTAKRMTDKCFPDIASETLNFYGNNPKACCEQQVKLFLEQPQHLSIHYKSNNLYDYTHQLMINQMNRVAAELGHKPNSVPQRGTLVVLGLAAGYHVELLCEAINYSDIIILEPSEEMQAMAASHIDFKRLETLCKERGGSFSLLHSDSYISFEQALIKLIERHGAHLVADISLYRHYSNPLFDEIFSQFKIWRNRLASLWGFLEDELVGFSHTLENSKHHQIDSHLESLSEFADLPLVIAGNGPSLDNDLEYLQKHQQHFLIASCGTSLNPLLNNNITPDFHIEMERFPSTFYIKEEQVRDTRMQDVTLIALNTVYPKYLGLFSNRIVFSKANDLGSHLYSQKNKKVIPLYNCNPTVTNMALASLTRLGFKNVILIGCDYGYIDPKYHHSKNSAYFDKSSTLSGSNYSAEIEVKGNFRQSVYTDRIYNESRLAQQRLVKNMPKVKVINCSDGAYIDGTITQRLNKISTTAIDKSILQKAISQYAQTHRPQPVAEGETLSQASNIVFKLKQKIRNSSCATQILRSITIELEQLVRKKEYRHSFYILSGTLKYIATAISSHINHLPKNNQDAYCSHLKQCLETHFDLMLERLNNTQ